MNCTLDSQQLLTINCPMSKIDRAQVQLVISNIDEDFQPMEDGEKARVAVLSSAYLACEIREVFHIRGRLFAEKKGLFIDASDQMIKAAGFPSDNVSPSLVPVVSAETCYNDAALYILLAVASNSTELERKLDIISQLSRIACIQASRLNLLQKFRLGQFVSVAEKDAFLASCPAKWRSVFQASLSLHHLLACFKMYDNICIDALSKRMNCSEDDCIKYLLESNRTNTKYPNPMIPSTIDQVKGIVHFVHAKGIVAFNQVSKQFLRDVASCP